MDILRLGETLPIRETINSDGKKNEGIIFENQTQDLKRKGHPGMVLIPAGIDDEIAYCAYMTSDPQRYNDHKEKYYVMEEGIKRKSYVNLENLVRIKNNLRQTVSEISYEKCYEILKAICEYQAEYGECEAYAEIKDKIQAVLYLIEQSREHKGVEVDSQNVKMLENVHREYWDLLMYDKYHSEYSKRAEYESKLVRVYRFKEKIEDFAKHYNSKDARKTERIKALYSDLKVFFGIGLEETMACAIALLRSTETNENSIQTIEEIEEGISECIRTEKEKQKAKVKKSEDKKIEKRKEREEAQRKKFQKQKREDIKKYGRRLKGKDIKPVGESR